MIANQQKGVTLLELMVVVAIIGILASIAYPSYQESVAEGRRTDAQANIVTLAQHMEREFTENGNYTGAGLPYDKSPRDGADRFYTLSIVSAAASYTVRATPVNAMAGDRCGVMTLNHRGQRTDQDAQDDCW